MKPLVSIGIPTFHRYERLRTCLSNVLAQDYERLDILVSDNSSDMIAPDWLIKLVQENRNIKYVKHKINIGMIPNENFVRANRAGEYIVVIHDDDEIPHDYISKLIAPLLEDRSIVLSGPVCERFLNGNYWYTYQTYTSTDLNQVARLSQLARYAFENPWGFEHLVYGIYKSDALPCSFRFGQWRSIILFFYMLSIRGSIHTNTNCLIRKQNTTSDLQKYKDATYVQRSVLLKFWLNRRQEERITILARLTFNTLRSKDIPLRTKIVIVAEAFKAYLKNNPELSLAP